MVGGSGMFNGVDGNDLQFAVWARTRTIIKTAQSSQTKCKILSRCPACCDKATSSFSLFSSEFSVFIKVPDMVMHQLYALPPWRRHIRY